MFDFFKVSYSDLIRITPTPTYRDLLNTYEWEEFRKSIILRDMKCLKCSTILESDEKGYFRKPTSDEIAKQDKEWEDYKGIDLFEDGKSIIKGKKPIIVGVPVIVQVHHKYYIYDNLPWEYDKSALMTVCKDCHIKIHAEEEIYMYTDSTCTSFKKLVTCQVCSGTGYRPEYNYWQDGICFYCDGRGFNDTIIHK